MRAREFRRAGHLPTLIAALWYFEVSFMVWVLLGALGPTVASDLGLSPAQKGLLVAVPVLGGALVRLPAGRAADRYGARRVGLLGLGSTLLPLGWGALGARTYLELLAVGLLLGVAGASFAVALPLASRWYPPRFQGVALGIAGAGNSGTIIAALMAPRLAERLGWHGVFAAATLPVAAAWVVLALLAREPPRAEGPLTRPTDLISEPDARRIAGLYAVTFGGFVGLASYLPVFLVDHFGVSAVAAGTYAAVCAGAGSLLRPFGGLLADRLGGTRVLGRVLAAVAGLSVVVAGGPGLALTVGALVALLGVLGVGNGAIFQLVPQRFPDEVGAVTGFVGAAGALGGFVLPFGLGLLEQATGSFAPGFLGLALVAFSVWAGLVRLRRTWRERWDVEVAV